jgi:hypothetical protein
MPLIVVPLKKQKFPLEQSIIRRRTCPLVLFFVMEWIIFRSAHTEQHFWYGRRLGLLPYYIFVLVSSNISDVLIVNINSAWWKINNRQSDKDVNLFAHSGRIDFLFSPKTPPPVPYRTRNQSPEVDTKRPPTTPDSSGLTHSNLAPSH